MNRTTERLEICERERERETEGLDRFAATPNSTFDSMVHGPSQHIPAMRASQMFGTDYT